jgi:glycosyltransferase involved in cell wall biosynthesis
MNPRGLRVVLCDPAAFTLPYDHQLARALAALGVEVELLTSHFRYGEPPTPEGYRRREPFYPASSRLFRRSPLRLPLKAAEHVAGLGLLAATRRDVLHVQWAPLPELDVRLMPAGPHSVITAHDILPRRTAGRPTLWQRLYSRFRRVVVHSDNGRERLGAEVGVAPEQVVVIPHPVFPGTVRHEDDGRTLAFLGLIQPYKQLEHAVTIAREVGARLIVAGDARCDIEPLRGLPDIEWRLGYQSDAQLDDVLARTTVALFPYRQELDQSGALLRALGSGVPVGAYRAGGIAEPVERYGAGVVAAPDDVAGLVDGVRLLLESEAALQQARAGALKARSELTWHASATAHLALYDNILGR